MDRTEGRDPMTIRQRILWSVVWLPVAVVITVGYAVAVAVTWLRDRLAPLAPRQIGRGISAMLADRSDGLRRVGGKVGRHPSVVPEIGPSLDSSLDLPDAGNNGIR